LLQCRLENGARIRVAVATSLVELSDVFPEQCPLGVDGDPAFHGGEDVGSQPLTGRLGRKVVLVGGVAPGGSCRNPEGRAHDLQGRYHSLRKHYRFSPFQSPLWFCALNCVEVLNMMTAHKQKIGLVSPTTARF
jgi:hypothetical protein